MVKFYNGIQFKMTVGFILLITLVVGATFFLLVSEGKNAVKDQKREELADVASMVATQFS
jgi:hypothetical protein